MAFALIFIIGALLVIGAIAAAIAIIVSDRK